MDSIDSQAKQWQAEFAVPLNSWVKHTESSEFETKTTTTKPKTTTAKPKATK